ncbi:MAG: hypothetical protein E7436_01130 [Ruminococcaceae bacterium]|nr:hypothetical protein [Oscillospiraceae bacterium]
MTQILYISTALLILAGAAYAVAYLWINGFHRLRDTETRNPALLKAVKTAQTLALIFIGVTCLLAPAGMAEYALDRAAEMYAILLVASMAVILACGVTVLVVSLRKSGYRVECMAAVGRLFKATLRCALIALLLGWLLM